ncbi:hypothetical protein [Legionella yabuuchiae]|uniref:hypothetical protein n=1 Tax=Legionella yabuuchiae TaxID=376727 RepID=UPI00105471F5|nr:hypothetical protein [Legionella yabuuchiae]
MGSDVIVVSRLRASLSLQQAINSGMLGGNRCLSRNWSKASLTMALLKGFKPSDHSFFAK